MAPNLLSRLFRKPAQAAAPSTAGRLVYAVGDVHGHNPTLLALLDLIRADMAAQPHDQRPLLIFLGDYVDRGPDSAGVLQTLLALEAEGVFEVHALKGNHEEALLDFLADPAFGATWSDYGGNTTLASYGVQPPVSRTDVEAWIAARDAFARALPSDHLALLHRLELMVELGDFAFVHAGVRPGVSLANQTERDLLWIRQEFLQATGRFEKLIVHGHTPMEEPQVTSTRMGLDTGVYATGILTAARIDDRGYKIIQARRPN